MEDRKHSERVPNSCTLDERGYSMSSYDFMYIHIPSCTRLMLYIFHSTIYTGVNNDKRQSESRDQRHTLRVQCVFKL